MECKKSFYMVKCKRTFLQKHPDAQVSYITAYFIKCRQGSAEIVKEDIMEKITVNMTKEALFDFLLFHAYSKFTGFLINILGLAIAFMGIILYVTGRTGPVQAALYIAAAFIFLGYAPIQLKLRAKKQVQQNADYSCPVDYSFSEEGIVAERDGSVKEYAWETIQKAVVTPKTIGIYYEGERALIIPKEDFGNKFVSIFQMIAFHLGRGKVQMH